MLGLPFMVYTTTSRAECRSGYYQKTFEVIEIHLASFFIGRCYCVLSVNGSIEMSVEALVQMTFDLTSVGAVPSRGALGHIFSTYEPHN